MFKLIWRNLWRNPLRTTLTLASVAVALLVLCLLAAVLAAIERAEGVSETRYVVRNAVSITRGIPAAYGAKLRQFEHVLEVTPLTWYGGLYKDERPENFFAQFMTEPESFLEVFSDLQLSEKEKQDFLAERTAAVAGKELADKYGWSLGDTIHLKGTMIPIDLELTLRGIYEQPEARSMERQMFFNQETIFQAIPQAAGAVGTFWLRLDDPTAGPAVSETIEAAFANSMAQVKAESEESFQLSFLELMGNVRLFLGAIGLAIVISLLFITANTMAMAARERTTEVAVLKTLGFRRRQVLWVVTGEALLVGICGAVVGVLGAMGAVPLLKRAIENTVPQITTLLIEPGILALCLVLGLLIGLASGLPPAIAAARSNIVNALGRVG